MKTESFFKLKIRKPKQEEKFNYKNLELNVSLYDIDKKRKKENKSLIEEGSFLLNEKTKILAAGSFFIVKKNENNKKILVIKNVKADNHDYEKYAINALKEYSSKEGYEFI